MARWRSQANRTNPSSFLYQKLLSDMIWAIKIVCTNIYCCFLGCAHRVDTERRSIRSLCQTANINGYTYCMLCIQSYVYLHSIKRKKEMEERKHGRQQQQWKNSRKKIDLICLLGHVKGVILTLLLSLSSIIYEVYICMNAWMMIIIMLHYTTQR